MKYLAICTLFLVLCSCETRSVNGHVYTWCQYWQHDPECGKCKEIEKENK